MRCDGHPHSLPRDEQPVWEPCAQKTSPHLGGGAENKKLLPAGMGCRIVLLIPGRGWGHELPPGAL